MGKRVLVGYGVDIDAVSGWIDTKDGTQPDPVEISRGLFGATIGIDRLLHLFESNGIKASWYIPAHTAESFPKCVERIAQAGHEIGLHGYTHEYVSGLSEDQERAILYKSIEVLTVMTGKRPRGWTAPAWTVSPHTVRLLEEAGVEYDHSFMHHDCQVYPTPYSDYGTKPTQYKTINGNRPDASVWMQPMPAPLLSSLVTVPANWHLDDWPPFAPGDGGSNGFIDPYLVERMWREHFEYFYETYDEFVFPLSIHPQISSKPHVLRMHKRMIDWLNTFEGVEWHTFEGMVHEYKKLRGDTKVHTGSE